MITPIQETNKQYAHRIIQNIAYKLWDIHDQYEQNVFFTTGEVKDMCQDFAQDLLVALEALERKTNNE
jgi:hypothetical protein|tara:strand:- start:278 stop:481 length:204 start_codon:yes stop_codon:yes gene_type:complete